PTPATAACTSSARSCTSNSVRPPNEPDIMRPMRTRGERWMKPRTPAVTPSRLAEAAGRLRTVFAATLAAAAPALAQTPQGPQVVAGSATFQQNGSTTVITAGNNTIINYQSFNIGHGQTVQFV